jgi:hypothetical protein
MTDGLHRRAFLAGVAGAAGAAVGLGPLAGRAAIRWAGCGHFLVPGDVINVPWPSSLDHLDASLIHTLDGVLLSSVPLPAPEQGLVPHLSITIRTGDDRLRTGRHDFFIEMQTRRLWLGGFDVATHHFGY